MVRYARRRWEVVLRNRLKKQHEEARRNTKKQMILLVLFRLLVSLCHSLLLDRPSVDLKTAVDRFFVFFQRKCFARNHLLFRYVLLHFSVNSLLIVHTLSCSVDLTSKMMSKTAGHEVLLENSVVSKLETSLQTLTSFLDSQVRC